MSHLNRGRKIILPHQCRFIRGSHYNWGNFSHAYVYTVVLSSIWPLLCLKQALLFVLYSRASKISTGTSLDRQARHIHFAPLAINLKKHLIYMYTECSTQCQLREYLQQTALLTILSIHSSSIQYGLQELGPLPNMCHYYNNIMTLFDSSCVYYGYNSLFQFQGNS